MKSLLHLTWAAALFCTTLFAGTTGKIAGTVTEQGRGEPLAGANVTVVGTRLGASTGPDGSYFILNVPPGVYDLRVTLIGYASTTITNVRVEVDRTAKIDIQCAPSAVGMDEVVVRAVAPPFQRDATASVSVISSEQISELPAKDFSRDPRPPGRRGRIGKHPVHPRRTEQRGGLPDRRHVRQGSGPRLPRDHDPQRRDLRAPADERNLQCRVRRRDERCREHRDQRRRQDSSRVSSKAAQAISS